MRYYYQSRDGEMVGPVERTALKAAKALGYLDDDSPVVPEGSETWTRYGDLPGETPPPPPSHRHAVPYHTWVNDFFVTQCPSCRGQVRVGTRLLGRKTAACPACGGKLRLGKIALVPENPAPYRLSYAARFFSYQGRAGLGDFWLLFGIPAMIPFFVEACSDDGRLVPPIILIAVRLLALAWLIPVGLPAFVRRLHDRNQNGAWACALILFVVPSPLEFRFLLGICIFVMLGMFKGEKKFNRYGPPPSKVRYG